MALADYRWQITGDTEVYPGLTLRNPEFKVESVYYHTPTRKADIEVVFYEGVAPHSRMFSLQVPAQDEGLTAQNIKLFITMNFPTATQIAGDNIM